MPNQSCPVSGTPCLTAARVEALEKTLEREACQRSQSHSEIFGRLNALERGMATVTTQYDSIAQRLSCISADINAIKDQPSRRWETVLAAAITGVVGYLLARLGLG